MHQGEMDGGELSNQLMSNSKFPNHLKNFFTKGIYSPARPAAGAARDQFVVVGGGIFNVTKSRWWKFTKS